MALTKCPECRKKVSDTAEKCPNCGFDIRVWQQNLALKQSREGAGSKFKRFIGYMLIVFLVFAGVNYISGQDNSTGNNSGDRYPESSSYSDEITGDIGKKPYMTENSIAIANSLIEDDASGINKGHESYILDLIKDKTITIKASDYSQSYNDNEISADNKYKGNHILVTGLITGINKSFTGGAYLTFRGSGYSEVMASYESSDEIERILSSYSKGEIVKAVCVGDGLTLMTSALDDCVPLNVYAERESHDLLGKIKRNNSIDRFISMRHADNESREERLPFFISLAAVAASDRVDCISHECSSDMIEEALSDYRDNDKALLEAVINNIPVETEKLSSYAASRGYESIL